MADPESPERLPIGWTEKLASKDGEEIKFYYNVITGQKFYSKDDLFRYVEMGIPSQNTRKRTREQKEGNLENRLMIMPAETNKAPEWLPPGWIVELNATSSGQKYKRYIDPVTGRKFHSKPEILKYLNSDEYEGPMEQTERNIGCDNNIRMGESNDVETSQKTERSQTRDETRAAIIQKLMSSAQQKKFEIVRCEVKGLPPGWIKEIKVEKSGDKIRKDPYFTDPDSKYVFRSQPDALRYLKAKNINDCVMKPIKREDLKFLSDDISDCIGESSGVESLLKTEGSQTRDATREIVRKLKGCSQPKNFEIVRCEAKGLPPGWIKEIKIEKSGDKIRKDPYFTDPDSKYVFRSQPDALRYLTTKNTKDCAIKPRKREDLKFLSDDISIPEEQQSLDDTTGECDEREANHTPTSDEQPKTPVSKRKRGKPVAAPSTDDIMQYEKPAEVIIDSTKYEGKKVIPEEAVAKEYGVRMEERGERKSLEEPQPFERLGGDSSLDPCLEFAYKTLRGNISGEANNNNNNFAFKTLRGDISGEANNNFALKTPRGDISGEPNINFAAQNYNHQQRAPFNTGFPSFSDYARRQT